MSWQTKVVAIAVLLAAIVGGFLLYSHIESKPPKFQVGQTVWYAPPGICVEAKVVAVRREIGCGRDNTPFIFYTYDLRTQSDDSIQSCSDMSEFFYEQQPRTSQAGMEPESQPSVARRSTP